MSNEDYCSNVNPLVLLDQSNLKTDNIIDIDDVETMSCIRERLEMAIERKEILAKHPYKIGQLKDGRYYTVLPKEDGGRRQIRHKDLKTLEDEIIEYWKSHEGITFETAFNEWIEEKLKLDGIRNQTGDRYKADFKRYFSKTDFKDHDIKTITERDLSVFIRSTITEQQLTRKAYRGLVLIINGTFKYAKDVGYTDFSITNFFGDLVLPPNIFKVVRHKKEDMVYKKGEQATMEEYVENEKDLRNLAVVMVFQTGLRIGELSVLKWSDVGENTISITKTETTYKVDGKPVVAIQEIPKTNASFREVFINSKTRKILDAIKELNPSGEFLFMEDGKRINSKSIGHRLSVICKKTDVRYRSMHKLRRTYSTNLINSGADVSLITDQMGHTDIACTLKYYYEDNTTPEEAMEQIERIAK